VLHEARRRAGPGSSWSRCTHPPAEGASNSAASKHAQGVPTNDVFAQVAAEALPPGLAAPTNSMC